MDIIILEKTIIQYIESQKEQKCSHSSMETSSMVFYEETYK